MLAYIVSLSDSTIKVYSEISPDTVFEKKVSSTILDGSRILDSSSLAEQIGQLLSESYGKKAIKQPLHFLVEPGDFTARFILVGKNEQETLEKEINKRLEEEGLDPDIAFYSTLKVAPFVYQFLAIRKEKLEGFIELANLLGLSLAAIVPWPLLLPERVSKAGSPEIFIIGEQDKIWLVLSELNGIYHLSSIKGNKDIKEISSLVKNLSVYERSTPITKIYTLNMPGFDLGGSYEVVPLDYSNPTIIYKEALDQNLVNFQDNLLNMIPLPVAQKSYAPMVYVGGILMGMLVLGGFIFGAQYIQKNSALSSNDVLSETNEKVSEPTVETKPNPQPESEVKKEDAKPQTELKREYLKVRVENGTNIGGLAGRTRDFLVSLGYEVVGVGDADTSSQDAALVRFKDSNVLYKDLVVEDLKKKFGKVEVGAPLDSSSAFDTLIIAGSSQNL